MGSNTTKRCKYMTSNFWKENPFWKIKDKNGNFVPNEQYVQEPYEEFLKQCEIDDKRLMK
jgi:hypothetical protein